MFIDFFYYMRDHGLDVSLSEWLSLQEAMDKGLCHSSITEFYYVARMILLKSEKDFDKFDMIFDDYFKGIHVEYDDISDQMKRWLDKSEFLELSEEIEKKRPEIEGEADAIEIDQEEVLRKFRERQKEQEDEHNGGNQWIGTMGNSSFGNLGGHMGGVRTVSYTHLRAHET